MMAWQKLSPDFKYDQEDYLLSDVFFEDGKNEVHFTLKAYD